MGVCPIPTSEGDKKTKMETIVKRYDPVSRRTMDIRIDICPAIIGINVIPINPWGPWKIMLDVRNANKLYANYVSGHLLNIESVTLSDCIITNPNIDSSGTTTINFVALGLNNVKDTKDITIPISSVFTSTSFDGGNHTTIYDSIIDGGSANTMYTNTIDGGNYTE